MKTKITLREEYRKRRDMLTAREVETQSINISNQCLKMNLWRHSLYHLFMTSENKKEVDTSYLLSILLGKDKQPVIPKMREDHSLQHFLLTDQTHLKENSWGIPEPLSGIVIAPKQINVVFVPMLVFDEWGHRVGYGKGYYDRFLAQCSKSTLKVGLCFFDPVSKIEDINRYDIALDHAVTPKEVYTF